jgi:UDP-N-acetylmuramoyl-tripeptide--D-alanyl-D-alanine ligase
MGLEQIYQCFLKCNKVSTDTRTIEKDDFFVALRGDNFNGNKFVQDALKKGAKYALIDDKNFITKNTIFVKDALKTLQNLATFHRNQLKTTIISLTGSNGKTTTKELINAVLLKQFKTTATQGNLNNHIGVPLTLLSMSSQTEIGIVEMGANHQKEIATLCEIAQPDYGLITNFGKAHLEGFGGVEGVIKGKSELYDYLRNHHKTVFINTDDPIQVKQSTGINRYTFSKHSKTSLNIKQIENTEFISAKFNDTVVNSNLVGDYNFNNIAVAIAIGNYFKVQDNDIADAIAAYTPTNNRSQILHKNTNSILLDAYNANPSSMTAALENFSKTEGKKIAFLGDMFELGADSKKEHQAIVDIVEELSIYEAYLVGEHFFKTHPKLKTIQRFETFDDFKNYVSNLKAFKNCNILIKGSRGMAMERILDFL